MFDHQTGEVREKLKRRTKPGAWSLEPEASFPGRLTAMIQAAKRAKEKEKRTLKARPRMRGKRRYAEFQESREGIPTNILAERLKRLVAHGIVTRRRYSVHPPRVEYALTAKGEDLRPIVRAMLEWGLNHVSGTRRPEPMHS